MKESKAKVKREKTVITGDMKQLKDALLSVDEPEKTTGNVKKRPVGKPKAVQRESVRNKQAYVFEHLIFFVLMFNDVFFLLLEKKIYHYLIN
jgi:hypothetical protein